MGRWRTAPGQTTSPSIADGTRSCVACSQDAGGVSGGTTTGEARLSLLRGVDARDTGVLVKRDVEGLLTATQCHDGLVLNATTSLVAMQQEKE